MTTSSLPLLRSSLTRRSLLCGLASGAAAMTLAACSGSKKGDPSTVEYWLWDSAQLPAYQACAEAFKAKTGITVNITQIGWGDYWTKLTAGFIADTAPDVFTDHIAKFAQFVDLDVLLPLDEQAAWAATTATSTAAPRTGTPRRSSTTRPCSPTPA